MGMPWNANISCPGDDASAACSTSVKTSVEKCLPCWCEWCEWCWCSAKSCQDTGRIPGISAGRARPNGSRAQFEGKHNLERCRFLVLDFMVLVRFVLVLTFFDICWHFWYFGLLLRYLSIASSHSSVVMTDTCLLFRLAMGHEPLFMYTLGNVRRGKYGWILWVSCRVAKCRSLVRCSWERWPKIRKFNHVR